jgi:hypothetical protein
LSFLEKTPFSLRFNDQSPIANTQLPLAITAFSCNPYIHPLTKKTQIHLDATDCYGQFALIRRIREIRGSFRPNVAWPDFQNIRRPAYFSAKD